MKLVHDSELVVNSFVAFIRQRAAEFAPAMVCIEQNEAKKSGEIVYGLLVNNPDCQDKKNLQQDFSAFSHCAFHQSSRCMDIMCVNSFDANDMIHALEACVDGSFSPFFGML